MGLESATLIHELNVNNPVGATDGKNQGDDHIRMIKACLQNTLPNVDGVVNSSHTQLNLLANAVATTYVPTLTAVLNCSALTNQEHRYFRIGDFVIVSGNISLNTGGSGQVTFAVSLPIASNFTTSQQGSGGGSLIGTTISTAHIATDAANNRMSIASVVGGVGGHDAQYIFLYRII